MAGIASLSQPVPQLHHAQLGISEPHVPDQLEFRLRVLVGMMVRSTRLLSQRFYAAVPALAPEVDVRWTLIILPAGPCDAVLLCILHQGLTKPHVLCYSVHEE